MMGIKTPENAGFPECPCPPKSVGHVIDDTLKAPAKDWEAEAAKWKERSEFMRAEYNKAMKHGAWWFDEACRASSCAIHWMEFACVVSVALVALCIAWALTGCPGGG